VSDSPGKSSVPKKTAEQRSEALARANEVRSARKHLKERLKQGEADLAALVADYPSFLAAARISDLVQALPGYGPGKVGKLLSACRISPSKTVAGLTARQRRELIEALK
jgi:hypothetical protein